MANKKKPEQEEQTQWESSPAASSEEQPAAASAAWDETPPPTGDEPSSDVAEGSEWDVAPSPTYSPLVIKEHGGQFDPSIVKMLIYGESGAGKTRLASTFPNALFLDIDKGMASVTERVDTVDIDNFHQLEDALAFLREGNHSYETVVIDTLNEMQRIAMRITIEEFTHIRRSYGNLPGQSDYGKMLYDFMERTRDFVALPMRVVLLAQVGTRQFDTDILQPQLIGKNSAREVARKMDVMGYIYKSETSDPSGKKLSEISFDATDLVTKDRSFRLPAALLDPTYSKIASYWK